MEAGHPVTWLMFFTLASGVVIAGGAFLYFLRRGQNRYSAEQALLGEGQHREGPAPDGALPELIGILAIALVAMGLLTLGYSTP